MNIYAKKMHLYHIYISSYFNIRKLIRPEINIKIFALEGRESQIIRNYCRSSNRVLLELIIRNKYECAASVLMIL